jgi:hypothetical protein
MKNNTDPSTKEIAIDDSEGSLANRTFSSLKNPVYRLYYFGMLGQVAAMNMQMIAGSLLIYRITESPLILGAMSFANAIPMLILALFGGVIADRKILLNYILVGQTDILIR